MGGEKQKMELEVNGKTSSFSRPLIKKGYYPAQLTKVEERINKDGTPLEGKYGRQLIMQFQIYKPTDDLKNAEQVMFTNDNDEQEPVFLNKFVYHLYKDSKTGQLGTAVSRKSAITKVFEALGWEFDAGKKLDVDSFIGKWCEVNVDDYSGEDSKGVSYKSSSIKDIGLLEGASSSPQIPTAKVLMGGHKETTNDVEYRVRELQKLLKQGILNPDTFKEALQQIQDEKIKKT